MAQVAGPRPLAAHAPRDRAGAGRRASPEPTASGTRPSGTTGVSGRVAEADRPPGGNGGDAGGGGNGGFSGRVESWATGLGLGRRIGLALLAGAATTLAQPPVSLPAALFVAMPLLALLVWRAPGPWQAAAAGWAAGFGAFVTGLHWMGHAFLVDPERFAWLMPLAITALPAGLALFWAAAAGLTRQLAPVGPLAAALLFALALATAELARSHLLTGLPWGLPAYAWVETPVMQSARLLGPQGLSLLTLALAALPLAALRRPWLVAVPIMALGTLWFDGSARLASLPAPGPEAPVIRIVQPDAEQRLKWRPEHGEIFAERLIAGSAAPADPRLGPPDAVVWPETAITTFLPQDEPERVRAVAAAGGGAPLITGALFYAFEGPDPEPGARPRWSNSLIVATAADGITERYDKHHLVPFGEYLPMRDLLGALGLDALAGMSGGGLVPGPGPAMVDVPGLAPFAPAICYEMIFADAIVPRGTRPGWIVQITNDAWFGAAAGPQQHLAQARIRAIEQGLPVVRAANTGISAVIDAGGRIVTSIALGTHGHIDAALPPALPVTPYARWGEAPAMALVGLGWLAVAVAVRRRRQRGLHA